MGSLKNIAQQLSAPHESKSYIFVLFVTSVISSLYQIFLIKQLSITNALHSQTITINIIISLTLASLGLGAYLVRFFKTISISKLLFALTALVIFVNIFMVKFNFSSLSIANLSIFATVFIIFSEPMIVLGIIFAKIYILCIRGEWGTKQPLNNFWVGITVFTHTLGFVCGALLSIVFTNIAGANILLFICLVLICTALCYLYRVTYPSVRQIAAAAAADSGRKKLLRATFFWSGLMILAVISLIVFYQGRNIDFTIEQNRNARYLFWPTRFVYNPDAYRGLAVLDTRAEGKYAHLYSGWSAYSKIDFFSYETDCIGGAYNYNQEWMSCPQVASDFDFRKLMYRAFSGKVLLIGSGGGMGCYALDAAGKSEVTCIEIDPLVVELMKTRFKKFNGDIYNKVNVETLDGRFFLDSTNEKFDYIIYEGTDFTVTRKIKSLIEVEDYLYTYQGIAQALSLVGERGGILFLHTYRSLPFEKLKKILARLGITSEQYLYYDFLTKQPKEFYGKVMFVSKDAEKIEALRKIFDENTATFKRAAFNPLEDYPLVTDDKPFLYFQSIRQMFPFLVCIGALGILSLLLIAPRKEKLIHAYFLILGISLVLVEMFIITNLRSYLFDYVTTYIIVNAIMMLSFCAGSLLYQKIHSIIVLFPAVAAFFYFLITRASFLLPPGVKIAYLTAAIAPLFIFMGSYFPIAISNITRREFPALYMLDSVGSAIGFFAFYTIAIVFGIKYNFFFAAGLYTVLSIIAFKRFK